jgi:hypothetical protein
VAFGEGCLVRAAWPVALLVALAVLACGGKGAVVPHGLVGRWVCDDARYAGRSLTISQHSLIFATDRTTSENFAVRGVETRALPDGSTAVTIAYGNDAADDLALRVQLLATQPVSLRIGDRAERWTLKKEGLQ